MAQNIERERMESSNQGLKLILICIMGLAMAHVCRARQSHDSHQDYLDVHNAARLEVGLGPMRWDDKVAANAQNYANKRRRDCQLIHSGGPYGENIFWGSSPVFTARDAVKDWVSEKQYYNYESNTCADGQVCGHYTQVVWRDSVGLGCARVICNKNGGVFITCNYNPPGNYVGERPY